MKAYFRWLLRFVIRMLYRAVPDMFPRKQAVVHQQHLYAELARGFERSRGENQILAQALIERNGTIDGNRRQFRLMANEIIAKNAEITQLEALASIDPLTGLYNRRGANIELERTLSAFERRNYRASGEVIQHQLSVLVMDLNGFKLVNDQFGHATGDTVLVAVAEQLKAAFRPEDIVLRKGGDEFVIYLVNATQVNAVGSAERFRQRLLEDPRLRFGDNQVSMSIGISHGSFTTRQGGMQIIKMVEAFADTKMYEAKEKSGGFSGIVVAADAVYSDTAFGDL